MLVNLSNVANKYSQGTTYSINYSQKHWKLPVILALLSLAYMGWIGRCIDTGFHYGHVTHIQPFSLWLFYLSTANSESDFVSMFCWKICYTVSSNGVSKVSFTVDNYIANFRCCCCCLYILLYVYYKTTTTTKSLQNKLLTTDRTVNGPLGIDETVQPPRVYSFI